jgi:hypothetical protein
VTAKASSAVISSAIYYFGFTLLLACIGCEDVNLPAVTPQKIDNSVDAKELARDIAGQRCKYYGYKNLGIDDYGAQQFYCDRGMYTLELGQSHLFEQQFFSFKDDDEVRFRYSDKVLMKPQYVGEAKPQDANPAYYLEPIR